MVYTLKDKIFGFFGVNAKLHDTHKDVNKKGITERYNESLGEDYDDNVRLLVDNFQDNVANPVTCYEKFIQHLEYNVGQPLVLIDTPTRRRKMIQLSNTLAMIKGTLLSHQVLFGILGITAVTITLIEIETGFDSGFTFDDDNRVFDGSRIYCPHYTITLVGSPPQTDSLNEKILEIAFHLKPIDSEILAITYNGNPVPLS